MKSSVTWCSATSVTSILCLPMSCSSRSNGPVKLSRRTVNFPESASGASAGGETDGGETDGSLDTC